MAGYTRVDTSNNIADGNVISAADLDNEFDGIQAAFNASTGHNHDGTTGEGAPILVLGPTQDVVVGASTVTPKTTNTVDIGSSSLKFKDLFLAGNASIGGTLGVTGATTLSAALTYGGVTLSNAVTGTGNMVLSASPTLTGTLSGANASLSGTLAVTGVATLTAQPILSSLTASRAVFTDGSKGLVSNAITGTGNVVMSASPTLTGTISAEALTLSGAVTASGGTANGVAYLNGSKVLTTGSALTYNGTGLGVGVASALAKLHTSSNTGTAADFTGSIRVTNESYTVGTYAGVLFETADTLNSYITSVRQGSYAGQLAFGVNTGGSGTSLSEQMRLTSTGLGIGTSSPGAKLDVVTGSNNRLRVTESSSQLYFDSLNAAASAWSAKIERATTLKWLVASSGEPLSGMQLDSSGNLGLGVTPSASWFSGAAALQFGVRGGLVSSSSYTGLTRNAITTSAGFAAQYLASAAASMYLQGSGTHEWYTAPSGTAGNAISFSQVMTLDSSGNLGIGTSSPSDTLGYGKALDIQGTSGSALYARSATNSSSVYGVFAYDTNAVRVNVGAIGTNNYLRFITAVGEAARLDSSGNLGLGVTPSAWGSGYKAIDNLIYNSSYSNNGGIAGMSFNAYNNGTNWIYKNTTTANRFESTLDSFRWYTAPSGTAGNAISFTQAMTLSAAGKLGIGSTSPSDFLDIRNDTSGTQLRISTSDTGNILYAGWATGASYVEAAGYNSPALAFKTGGSERARIDNSGNFGIGTTTLGERLIVQGAGKFTSNANGFGAGAEGALIDFIPGDSVRIGHVSGASGSAKPVRFIVDGNERMRLDTSGNLLIGTTSGSSRFNLKGPVDTYPLATFDQDTATNNPYAQIEFKKVGSVVGSITSLTTGTAYNTSSDYRLKNITGPITTSGAYIDSLNPVEGTWKADGSTFVGLIAHEVQEASRTNVATGVKDGEQMQGMDYSSAEIIANLIAEVKSLRQRLAAAGI